MPVIETPENGYFLFADLDKPFDGGAFFGNDNAIELEVGAGRGDFIVEYAKRFPEKNFLAVERKENYLKRGVNKARVSQVDNVAFLNVDAPHFMVEYVPDTSLEAVHVYFPDPWPKKRHLKRRILQEPFLVQLKRSLKPGGVLYLRTDFHHYFLEMMELLEKFPEFEKIDTPEEVAAVQTGFEMRFRKQGIPIYIATFRLKG